MVRFAVVACIAGAIMRLWKVQGATVERLTRFALPVVAGLSATIGSEFVTSILTRNRVAELFAGLVCAMVAATVLLGAIGTRQLAESDEDRRADRRAATIFAFQVPLVLVAIAAFWMPHPALAPADVQSLAFAEIDVGAIALGAAFVSALTLWRRAQCAS